MLRSYLFSVSVVLNPLKFKKFYVNVFYFHVNYIYLLCKRITNFTCNVEYVIIVCALVNGYEGHLSAIIDRYFFIIKHVTALN